MEPDYCRRGIWKMHSLMTWGEDAFKGFLQGAELG